MRFIFRLLIAAILLLMMGVSLGPSLLSTEWGKAMLVKAVNHFSFYHLKIDVLDLSWSGTQEIAGLEIRDERGNLTFSCDELFTDATLVQILIRHEIGSMKVIQPNMRIGPDNKNASQVKIVHQAGFIPAWGIQNTVFYPLKGHILIEQGALDFLSPGLDLIRVYNIALSLESSQTGSWHIKANGQTVQNSVLGQFDLEGVMDEKIGVSGHLANFPTRSIDQTIGIFYPALKGLFSSGIGEALNVDLEVKGSCEMMGISLNANSPNFRAQIQATSNHDKFFLSMPALISLTARPEFAEKFAQLSLLKPVTLTFKIDDFRFCLPQKEIEAIQGNLSLSEIQLPDVLLKSAVISLVTDHVKKGQFTATLQSSQLSLSPMQFQWKEGLKLLRPTAFSGVANGVLTKFSLPLNWKELEVEAEINWRGKIKLSIATLQSIYLDYTFAKLPSPWDVLLPEPTTMHLKMDCMHSVELLKGVTTIDSFMIEAIPIQNIRGSFQFSPKNRVGSLQINGTIGNGEIEAQFSLQGKEVQTEGILKKIPVHLFELLFHHNELNLILGPKADLSFKGILKKETLELSLLGHSDLLQLDLHLKHAENMLSVVKPSTLSYTLTQKSYKALDHWVNPLVSSPFNLVTEAQLFFELNSLQLPTQSGPDGFPALIFDPSQTQLEGDFTVNQFGFMESSTGQESSLNHLELHLSQTTPQAPLSFHLHADVAPKSKFSLNGSFDYSKASTILDIHIEQFPSAILDVLARLIGKKEVALSTLLGPTVEATIVTQIRQRRGPLKMTINAPYTRISLEGNLKDGILTLNDTLYGQITMTPSLSRMLLKDINPLSISAIHATHPITLEIPASGFSLQLYPFSMKEWMIPQARIELGQIVCQNEGNLSAALALLKLHQFSNDQEIKLWFAPFDLHMHQGMIDCERTEILVADTFDICTWGQIDLVHDYVDTVLGLTASCLKKAFGIKELPSDYILQMAMKGPANDVQIDSSKATAKVAALLLWQKKTIAGALAGGPAGALIGGLLNQLGPLPDSDSKAPPAKHPFPWENSSEADAKNTGSSKTEKPKKKKLIKNSEKPLKQLLEILK